tara:strand:+ start:6625 stop:6849 length:225 start_codon:yes stop_codon:yes gene_type:complete
MARNYKNEYNTYHAKPTQKKRRAGRNAARRLMIKKVGRNTLKGKDVDHKDRNPSNNTRANLRIQSKRRNRSRNG